MKNLTLFDKFPSNSRVWLYQTNRKLDSTEINFAEEELAKFTKTWAAHGKQLWASAQLVNPFFLAVVVDENITPPSGCSIDASVHFIKDLGKELNVDFFSRMKVTYLNGEEISQTDFHSLKALNKETLVFDSLIERLDELKNHWPLKLNESRIGALV